MVWESHDKGKSSTLWKQIVVQISILQNRRWFRVLVPWLLATAWLFWGVRKQRHVVQVKKVRAQFPAPSTANASQWCYLNKAGTGKKLRSTVYSPYAVDWVAGCWAWLEGHHQNTTQSSDHRDAAIVFDEEIFDRFLVRPRTPTWNRQFFHALQFPIAVQDEPLRPLDSSTLFTKTPDSGSWFGNSHACYSLRERLWKQLEIVPSPAVVTAASSEHVRIGVADHSNSALITNSAILSSELQHNYPNATVSHRLFDKEATLVDQAGWYAQQDIVVTGHGAGVVNMMFMRPDAQLLELFPVNFYSEVYQPLAQQCGVHHEWFYDGGTNPVEDLMSHLEERKFYRRQNCHITLDQLKGQVDQMIANMKQHRRRAV